MNLTQDIFTYAVRGSGKWLLVTCAVLSVISDLAGFAPVFGWIATLLLSAYFCAIYIDLIGSTAVGGKEAPEFPEVGDVVGDILWPFAQVIIVFVVSFAPLLLYPSLIGSPNVLIEGLLIGWGCAYFPMAMLAVVVCGSIKTVSPHIVIPSIFRAGGLYWAAVLMLFGIYYGEGVIAETLEGTFFIQWLVMALVGSYVMMTNARILGVIWRERHDRLGWF